jgi:hypothetical protein
VGNVASFRRIWRRIWLVGLLAAAACATLKKDQTVCPEYRDLRCLSAETCSYDKLRGCRVCACSPADAPPGAPPPGIGPGDKTIPR